MLLVLGAWDTLPPDGADPAEWPWGYVFGRWPKQQPGGDAAARGTGLVQRRGRHRRLAPRTSSPAAFITETRAFIAEVEAELHRESRRRRDYRQYVAVGTITPALIAAGTITGRRG